MKSSELSGLVETGAVEQPAVKDLGIKFCPPSPSGISYPDTSRPNITPNHIDGPLLVMRDGRCHWLTRWERVLLFFGQTDAQTLEDFYWNRRQW